MRRLNRYAYVLALGAGAILAFSAANDGRADHNPVHTTQTLLLEITGQLDQLDGIETQLDGIDGQLDDIDAALDQLANRYVPFVVQVPGGLCNAAMTNSANPEIQIENDGTGPFVVTSVLIRRGFLETVDFMFLSVNGVVIDGSRFDTRTRNIFLDPSGTQTAVFHSADIMGMPVRLATQVGANHDPGGNVPHQIVADATVDFMLFCRSDNRDFDIDRVRVSGWRLPDDTISVFYVPGN